MEQRVHALETLGGHLAAALLRIQAHDIEETG
jgi:hypothetical protein